MASTDLVMDLRINYSNLGRDIAGAKRVLGGLGAGIGGLNPARFLAGIGAAVGLAVREFSKADHAAQDLRSALAANGNEVDANYDRMTKFAQAVRDSTVYSAAFVQELQAMALNLGVSAKQTDAVVQAGIGLGEKFFGGDAQHGVRAAALAVQGQTLQLTRMVPVLRQAHTEQGKLNIINRAATQGWAEAQNKAKTFTGALSSLARSFHEAGAAAGSAFAGDIEKLAAVADHAAQKIAGMNDSQKAALATETELAAAAAGGAFALGKVGNVMIGLRGIFGGSLGTLVAAGVALAGIGALFVNLTGKGETFGERLNDTWESIKGKVAGVGSYIETKWTQIMDGVVATYFRALEAFGGGDADAMFKQYLKDVESSAKAAQAEREASTKATIDKEVALHREGVTNIKAAIKSIPQAYRDMQTIVLQSAQEHQKKMDAATGVAAPPVAATAGQRGGRNFGREPQAARVEAARKEMAQLDRQEESYQASLSADASDENVARVAASRAAAAGRRRQLEGVITRGGELKPAYRYSRDQLADENAENRERESQLGETPGVVRRQRELYERDRDARLHPELRNKPDTADDIMRRQLGFDPKAIDDAGKKLGKAGDTLLEAVQKAKVLTVLKDD